MQTVFNSILFTSSLKTVLRRICRIQTTWYSHRSLSSSPSCKSTSIQSSLCFTNISKSYFSCTIYDHHTMCYHCLHMGLHIHNDYHYFVNKKSHSVWNLPFYHHHHNSKHSRELLRYPHNTTHMRLHHYRSYRTTNQDATWEFRGSSDKDERSHFIYYTCELHIICYSHDNSHRHTISHKFWVPRLWSSKLRMPKYFTSLMTRSNIFCVLC
jgi:hypothetical protein